MTNSPKLHRGIFHIPHESTQFYPTQNVGVSSKPCKSRERKERKKGTEFCKNVEYKNSETQQRYLDREEETKRVSYNDNESERSKWKEKRSRLDV